MVQTKIEALIIIFILKIYQYLTIGNFRENEVLFNR